MIRRVVVIAFLAAALVLSAGIAAWRLHAGAVASVLSAQSAAARTLLDAGQTDPRVLAQTLIRPLVHIVIEDHASDTLYDARSGDIEEHPLPPAMGALPGEQGPQGPPPRAPQPRAPLTQFAAQLAGMSGVQPVRLEAPPLVLHITPDAAEMGRFLLDDAAITFAMLLALVTAATWISTTIARAERTKLEAIAEERRAAANEFQRFLADAGHELRTPLTIVSGYVDILSARADESEPHVKRIFDGMRAETARMRALVEKMLLLARLETPVAVPRLVDVATVAQDAAASMRAKFADRAIEVDGGDRASIVIDEDDLYEALHNLIENALKYAPQSPVTVQTGIHDGRAFARVVDRGPGIPAAEREAIFRRFYRGGGRSDSDGSGLGLAIVARVADRWNGTIDLASSSRETAFTLTFPLADEELHAVSR